MVYIKRALFVVFLGYASHWLYYRLLAFHVGVLQLNHRPGPCKIVPGVACGSEKIVATEDGIGFVTSGLKMLSPCNHTELEGRIYSINMNRPEAGVRLLKIRSKTIVPKDFSPHGMDLIEDVNAQAIKLYVISHTLGVESVEVFVYRRSDPDFLEHVQTIKDKVFYDLNDLTLVEDGSFYATNFLSSWSHVAMLFGYAEFLFQLKTGNVVFYDRKHGGRVMSSGLSLANGITLSHDKKKLFVTALGNTSLIVYNRNEQDNSLSVHATHQWYYPVDNIVYDRNSHYLYGGQVRNAYTVLSPKYSGEGVASTSVVQVKPRTPSWDDVDITEIFFDDGQFISAGSSAYHYQNKIFIGTVYHKFAYCDVLYPTDM